MSKTTIPKNFKWKGLHWYCPICNTSVAVGEGKEIPNCTHKDLWKLKAIVHVPGTENTRKSKVLKAKTIKEGIVEAAAFEESVINNLDNIDSEKEKELARKAEEKKPPLLLLPALARFNAFLSNEGVKERKARERSKEHLTSVLHSCELLVDCFSRKKDMDTFKVTDINDDEDMDDLFDFLKNERGYQNRTINKHVNVYKFFFTWWCKGRKVNEQNPFKEIEHQAINHNPLATDDETLQKILDAISKEQGTKVYETGVKRERQMFRSWLASSIQGMRLTGFRRETLLSVRMKDIFEDAKQRYIKIENHKINRIKNLQGNNKKFIQCPITPELQRFIDEQRSLHEYSPDDFLIAPTVVGSNRMKTMSDDMTRGFSHFAEVAGVQGITLKSVRKRYLTDLHLAFGAEAYKISGHSNNEILLANYIDKDMVNNRIANDLKEKEEARTQELEKIRNSQLTKKTLEK